MKRFKLTWFRFMVKCSYLVLVNAIISLSFATVSELKNISISKAWANTSNRKYLTQGSIAPSVSIIKDIRCSGSLCVTVGGGQIYSNNRYVGLILVSKNSGTNWVSVIAPTYTGILYQVSYSSSSICVAVGSTNSPGLGAAGLYTVDGGNTWIQGSGLGSSALYSVSCPRTTYCLAGGDTEE